MENLKEPIEDIIDDIKDYVDTSSELYKMKATAKAADIISGAVINLSLVLLFAFVLFFASFAFAYLNSEYFNHHYSGFFVVAGIYALIAFFIMATKDKWLKHRIVNGFIKSIYSI